MELFSNIFRHVTDYGLWQFVLKFLFKNQRASAGDVEVMTVLLQKNKFGVKVPSDYGNNDETL